MKRHCGFFTVSSDTRADKDNPFVLRTFQLDHTTGTEFAISLISNKHKDSLLKKIIFSISFSINLNEDSIKKVKQKHAITGKLLANNT